MGLKFASKSRIGKIIIAQKGFMAFFTISRAINYGSLGSIAMAFHFKLWTLGNYYCWNHSMGASKQCNIESIRKCVFIIFIHFLKYEERACTGLTEY